LNKLSFLEVQVSERMGMNTCQIGLTSQDMLGHLVQILTKLGKDWLVVSFSFLSLPYLASSCILSGTSETCSGVTGRYIILSADEAREAWGDGYQDFWHERAGGYLAG
tara:strand:+ start:4640 stop:4963 length:324 start_codon:yes stop_codon:yes gene_type:complete